MEPKTNCKRCGCEIQQRTADKTGGYCRICENYEEKEAAAQRKQESIAEGLRPLTDDEFDAALEMEDLESLTGYFYDKATWRATQSPLTDGEAVLVAIESFMGEVTNGGVYQFLLNDFGALAGVLPGAFQRLGFDEWAQLAQDIRAGFPGDVPADRSIRFEQVTQIEDNNPEWIPGLDARFFKLWDGESTLVDCRTRLRAFIAENRDEFVHG